MFKAPLSLLLLTACVQVDHATPSLERFEQARTAMGTQFRVVLYAPDSAHATQGFRAAFAQIEQVEQIFSDYLPTSEVVQLAATAAKTDAVTWHPVSPKLASLLAVSLDLAKHSNGAFDPTLGRLTKLWRRSKRQGELPHAKRLAAAQATSGHDKIELRMNPPAVRFLAPGIELDFGGIAKGYALDLALSALRDFDIESALVDGGGDIAVSAAPPEHQEGWRIVREGASSTPIQLQHAAIATSGDRYQSIEIGGVHYSHLIDPHTGLGLTEILEASVQSSSGMIADALASMRCVADDEVFSRVLDRYSGVATLTSRKSSITTSSNFPHKRRPNILFILADDLGWADLGCQGSTSYRTPALDQLAKKGIRFTHAYAAAANCAPTRATLMTGQSIPVHGMYTVGGGARGKKENRKLVPPPNVTEMPSEIVTLAESLHAAGYRTGHFGKWHLGGYDTPEGPQAQGFDINIGGYDVGHPPTYFWPYQRQKDGKIIQQLPGLEEGLPGEYLSNRLTDEALQFLEAEDDRPWFLYFPHYAVHTPIQAPKLTVASVEKRGLSGRQANPTYTAMVENLDQNCGRLIQWLERNGELDNTIIIFTSDNGGYGGYLDAGVNQKDITHNYPLKGGKGMMSEGGIRVPLLIQWPKKIQAGQINNTPVHTLDFYPTLLAATGTPSPPQQLEGRNLSPLWTQPNEEANEPHSFFAERALYFHMPGYLEARKGTWRATPAGAIRRGKWKLIEPFDDKPVELYDLHADPSETANLAGTEIKMRDTLLAELQEWRMARKAPMPTPID
ncbi:MAG: sulfatase-like hydrolase/transferase [Planctomycetes bacterium]|nr:sulfatase-like hydrolase/transferase [Planctomycetota bacterium]